MHLYLRENPRTIYLVTSSQEEINGRPKRALVFRAAEDNPYQAVVELLQKDQVNLSNTVRLTSRVVKGCLGLICVADGALEDFSALHFLAPDIRDRSLPCHNYLCHGDREHQTDGRFARVRRQDPRSQLLLLDVFCMG